METEGLKLIPYMALILAISGIIIGAAAMSLGKFGDTLESKCWNSSYTLAASGTHCAGNASLVPSTPNDLNFSNEYFAIYQAKEGQTTVAEQLPTVAIIGVMVLIISLIAGVFVYMKYFGG